MDTHPAREYRFTKYTLLDIPGARDSLKAAYLLGRAEADLESWLYEQRTDDRHPTLSRYNPEFVYGRVGQHAGEYMKAALALDAEHASMLKLATDGTKAEDRRRRQRMKRQVLAELRSGQ